MTPKEIIRRLSLLRVEITERTLYNYSAWGLIPEPQRGSGRSGKWVEYPEEALGEAYASWQLLHGNYWGERNFSNLGLKPPKLDPETIAATRKLIADIESQDWAGFKHKPGTLEESIKFILLKHGVSGEVALILLTGYIKLWKMLRQEAYWRIDEILNDPEY